MTVMRNFNMKESLMEQEKECKKYVKQLSENNFCCYQHFKFRCVRVFRCLKYFRYALNAPSSLEHLHQEGNMVCEQIFQFRNC